MSRHKAGPMAADDPRHGSPRGYKQHIREGSDACQPCKDANHAECRRYKSAPTHPCTICGKPHRRDHEMCASCQFSDDSIGIPDHLRPVVIGGITRWVEVA